MKTMSAMVVDIKVTSTVGSTQYPTEKKFVLPNEHISTEQLKECKIEAIRLTMADRDCSKIELEVRTYPCILVTEM